MAISVTPEEKAVLKNITVPPRPEVLLRVSEEMKKAEPNVAVIAEAITSDVGIAAAVLQVVNSAAFRRLKEIKSIQQAVMILGLQRVFPIVKAVALRSSMKVSLDLDKFWELASDMALASASVCNHLGKNSLADNAYMLGLFHMAGVPIMIQAFSGYSEVMDMAEREGWDGVIDEERRRYQTNYATIGALLAQTWKLPAQLIEVIYYHQDVEGIFQSGELADVTLDLLGILKMARRVVAEHRQDFNVDNEWHAVQDHIFEQLDLDEFSAEQLFDRVIHDLQNQNG